MSQNCVQLTSSHKLFWMVRFVVVILNQEHSPPVWTKLYLIQIESIDKGSQSFRKHSQPWSDYLIQQGSQENPTQGCIFDDVEPLGTFALTQLWKKWKPSRHWQLWEHSWLVSWRIRKMDWKCLHTVHLVISISGTYKSWVIFASVFQVSWNLGYLMNFNVALQSKFWKGWFHIHIT